MINLEKIDKISPSKYLVLQYCPASALRWRDESGDELPAILPSFPHSYLGDVVHKIMEKVNNGDLQNFEQQWEEIVARRETRMLAGPNARFVPLCENVSDYYVKKYACEEMTKISGANNADKVLSEYQLNNEVFKGSIDCIMLVGETIRLIDYKSGAVADDDGNTKEDYVKQMQVYSALIKDHFGKSPDEVVLVDIFGHETVVGINEKITDSIKNEAISIRDDVNKAIDTGIVKPLFCPSEKACKFCTKKPYCLPYWTWNAQCVVEIVEQKNRTNDLAANRANDYLNISGKITKIERSNNGNLVLTLISPVGEIKVNNISPWYMETGMDENCDAEIYSIKMNEITHYSASRFTIVIAQREKCG